MSTTATNPLAELLRYLTGWSALARSGRRFTELLGIEVTQDVVSDVVSHQRQQAEAAYKAEQHDREALRLMDAAQQPASDGGENITPREAKRIRALTAKSAEIDHDAAEALAV